MRFRGVERIRTAVDGVADHCLATRPRHPLGWQIYIKLLCRQGFFKLSSFLIK